MLNSEYFFHVIFILKRLTSRFAARRAKHDFCSQNQNENKSIYQLTVNGTLNFREESIGNLTRTPTCAQIIFMAKKRSAKNRRTPPVVVDISFFARSSQTVTITLQIRLLPVWVVFLRKCLQRKSAFCCFFRDCFGAFLFLSTQKEREQTSIAVGVHSGGREYWFKRPFFIFKFDGSSEFIMLLMFGYQKHVSSTLETVWGIQYKANTCKIHELGMRRSYPR